MRKVFFSFHYQKDVGRIFQVRNSWLTKGKTSSFLDVAEWESIKKNGDDAIKKWINEQLDGTSVTIVLIGVETANRRWVKYEIEKSIKKKNGLVGIYIHNIKDFRTKQTDVEGEDPFRKHFDFRLTLEPEPPYPCCSYYDWVNNEGYKNIENWIENAAQQAER